MTFHKQEQLRKKGTIPLNDLLKAWVQSKKSPEELEHAIEMLSEFQLPPLHVKMDGKPDIWQPAFKRLIDENIKQSAFFKDLTKTCNSAGHNLQSITYSLNQHFSRSKHTNTYENQVAVIATLQSFIKIEQQLNKNLEASSNLHQERKAVPVVNPPPVIEQQLPRTEETPLQTSSKPDTQPMPDSTISTTNSPSDSKTTSMSIEEEQKNHPSKKVDKLIKTERELNVDSTNTPKASVRKQLYTRIHPDLMKKYGSMETPEPVKPVVDELLENFGLTQNESLTFVKLEKAYLQKDQDIDQAAKWDQADHHTTHSDSMSRLKNKKNELFNDYQALLVKYKFQEEYEFNQTLSELNETIYSLHKKGGSGPLLNYAESIRNNIQDLQSLNIGKNADQKLTLDLSYALQLVTNVVKSTSPETLLSRLELLDNYQKTLPDKKSFLPLNHNISKYLAAGVVVALVGVYVAVALKVPLLHNMAIGLDVVSRAMGRPVPGLGSLISAPNIVVNAGMGIGMAIAGEHVIKKTAKAYRESGYNKELDSLQAKIDSINRDTNSTPATKALAEGAQNAINAIKLIKWSKDDSIQIKELTAGLKVMNNTLKDPVKWNDLQPAALFGDSMSPKSSQALAFGKYSGMLAIVVGVGICVAAVVASNAPGVSLISPSIMTLGSKFTAAGMLGLQWELPKQLAFAMSGPVLPQLVVSGAAKLSTLQTMEHMRTATPPDNSRSSRNNLVQSTFKDEKDELRDPLGNNLTRTMRDFKATYNENKTIHEQEAERQQAEESTPPDHHSKL